MFKWFIITDKFGGYDLAPNFNGEDRYGETYYYVRTDNSGFRINHSQNEEIKSKSKFEEQIVFLGDSFTFGVGINWEETFVGILNKNFKINAINAGVNSHSPTAYKFKLKRLVEKGLISNNQKIVIGLDISDVYDEATRWTEYKGKLASIKKLNELSKINSFEIPPSQTLSKNNDMGKTGKFYSMDNFKLTYQIYFGIEKFIKRFIDDIQVRNNDRSKFTHKDWEIIQGKFAPLGVENALNKIKYNLLEISKIAEKNKNQLYLLIYPWPAQIAYESSFNWPKYVKDICVEIKCAGVIDTFPKFDLYKKNYKSWQKDLFIRGDMHFNQKGNDLLAEIIAVQLNLK